MLDGARAGGVHSGAAAIRELSCSIVPPASRKSLTSPFGGNPGNSTIFTDVAFPWSASGYLFGVLATIVVVVGQDGYVSAGECVRISVTPFESPHRVAGRNRAERPETVHILFAFDNEH